MNGTDTELIGQYASTRDAEAFAELVTRHRDMVYAACYRVLGSRPDAEDAAQECFLRLAKNAAGIRSSVTGWLHRVAVRVSLNWQRQNRSRQQHEQEAVEMVANGGVTPGHDEACWDEIKIEVDGAIDRLPESLRDPLVMHFLEEKSQTEIAGELGISQPAVSKRLSKGLERLRRHFRRLGLTVSAATLAHLLGTHAAEASPATLVAELGKMAIFGVESSAVPAGVAASALAKLAAMGGKANATCAVVALLAGGIAVQQAVRSRQADRRLRSRIRQEFGRSERSRTKSAAAAPTETATPDDAHQSVSETAGVAAIERDAARNSTASTEPRKAMPTRRNHTMKKQRPKPRLRPALAATAAMSAMMAGTATSQPPVVDTPRSVVERFFEHARERQLEQLDELCTPGPIRAGSIGDRRPEEVLMVRFMLGLLYRSQDVNIDLDRLEVKDDVATVPLRKTIRNEYRFVVRKQGDKWRIDLQETLRPSAPKAPDPRPMISEFESRVRGPLTMTQFPLLSDSTVKQLGLESLVNQLHDQTRNPELMADLLMLLDVPDNAEIELGEPTIDDDAATVPVTKAIPFSGNLGLRREEGGWRIDLLLSAEASEAIPPEMAAAVQEAANQQVCLSNVKQIMLAVHMFARDHNGTLPAAATWSDSLRPYLPEEKVLRCPADPEGECGYAFNAQFAGIELNALENPARTVLVFGSTTQQLNAADEGATLAARHGGDTVLGFADGHIERVTPARAEALLAALPAPGPGRPEPADHAKQVLIEAKIVAIDRDAVAELGIEWGEVGPGNAADKPRVGVMRLRAQPNADGAPQETTPLLVELLEEVGVARVLATPRLLALVGTKAEVTIGGEIPIPVVKRDEEGKWRLDGDKVHRRLAGVRLLATPRSVRGNDIELDVRVELSIPDFENALEVEGATIPMLATREWNSSVTAQLGQTMVLGGVVTEEQFRPAPALKDIPVIGRLFRGDAVGGKKRELLILLTLRNADQVGQPAAVP